MQCPPVVMKFAGRCAFCAQKLQKENNIHQDLKNLQSEPAHFYECVYSRVTIFGPNLGHSQAIITQENEYIQILEIIRRGISPFHVNIH